MEIRCAQNYIFRLFSFSQAFRKFGETNLKAMKTSKTQEVVKQILKKLKCLVEPVLSKQIHAHSQQ